MTWKYHKEHFCNKSLKALELRANWEIFLVKGLWNNYFSFFHSYLNCADIAWASTNKSNLIYFYRHQNHAIRIIYEKDRFARMKSLFKRAKALTVYEINLFQILSLIFKCKNRTAPFVFHNLYTLKLPSKYFLRTDNLLSLPLKITKFGQLSICFRGPYLWNKLLAKKTFICNLECYPLFKNRLKKVIFSLNDTTLYFEITQDFSP